MNWQNPDYNKFSHSSNSREVFCPCKNLKEIVNTFQHTLILQLCITGILMHLAYYSYTQMQKVCFLANLLEEDIRKQWNFLN